MPRPGNPVTAHLDNVVDGNTVVGGRAATRLVADPVVLRLTPSLKLTLGALTATLTEPGVGPLAGRTVTFKAGSTTACTATTNQSGVASCSANNASLTALLSLGYTATYAGASMYRPATGKGALIS